MSDIETLRPTSDEWRDPQDRSENDSTSSVRDPGENAGITDGVLDQHGGLWIQYGTSKDARWVAVADLHSKEREVFSSLSGPWTTMLTASSRNRFKAEVENFREYRPALVAAHPGWLSDRPIFVTGNGRVIAPAKYPLPEIIIVFKPDPKFKPKGTSRGWAGKIGPVAQEQPLVLFALAYAFIGPLLRFAPAHVNNLQCELVGPGECGKTTIALAAASVWAGDPNNVVGGGESWDLTSNFIDVHKIDHSDMLLVLDEANLAGETGREQRELIKKSVFKIAGTGGKRRLTEVTPPPDVRCAVMSTSNDPLGDIMKVSKAVSYALESRMVTIRVPEDSPYGALSHLPAGFVNSQEAMQALRQTINVQYGSAGQRFVRRLVEAAYADEKRLRSRIVALLREFDEKASRAHARPVSKRHQVLFGMAYAAGSLARMWHILPAEWGCLASAIQEVVKSTEDRSARLPAAIEQIMRYVEDNRREIIDIGSIKAPIVRQKFRASAGFYRVKDGIQEVLIPSSRFQEVFPTYRETMQELKKNSLARTEGGKSPKLSIKAPSGICRGERVYCITIGPIDSSRFDFC